MTDPKKPTYAALLRKIERLEKLVQEMHAEQQRARSHVYDLMTEKVDYKMRAEQAVRLLTGEDA
jgi:putative hemolysin